MVIVYFATEYRAFNMRNKIPVFAPIFIDFMLVDI